MKRMKQRLGIYTVLLFLLTVTAVILRTLALLYDFDFKTGYFDSKLLSGISDAVITVGVLFSLSYVAVGRCKALRTSFSSPAFYLPSGLLGVSLLFLSGEYFKSTFMKMFENSNLGFKVFTPQLTLELLLASLALASIGYCILGVFIEGRRDVTRGVFGIIAALFFAFYAAHLYFDTTLPINAPTKILDEIAYVFTAAFFLFETRISLGRDKWGAYLAFGMAAAILCAASSIPSLILYFTRGAVIAHSLTESVLTATLFIFIFARVLQALSLRLDKQSPIAVLAEMQPEISPEDLPNSQNDADSEDGEPYNYTMTFEDIERK